MKRGQDIVAEFPGILVIHQKIPGYVKGHHGHDEHELFIPLQGEIRIRYHARDGERPLVCGPGRMVYMPPDLHHSFESSAAGQGERIIALIDAVRWKRAKAPDFGPSVVPANQLFKELVFYLLLHPKTRHSASILDVLIQTCSEALEEGSTREPVDTAHMEGKTGDERLKKALARIQEGFSGSVSMEEVARKSGLSVRTMNRLFLDELGLTPKQVHTQVRMAEATKRLQSGTATVTDVALEVGYSSLSQFITTYRRMTGRLPSDVAKGPR